MWQWSLCRRKPGRTACFVAPSKSFQDVGPTTRIYRELCGHLQVRSTLFVKSLGVRNDHFRDLLTVLVWLGFTSFLSELCLVHLSACFQTCMTVPSCEVLLADECYDRASRGPHATRTTAGEPIHRHLLLIFIFRQFHQIHHELQRLNHYVLTRPSRTPSDRRTVYGRFFFALKTCMCSSCFVQCCMCARTCEGRMSHRMCFVVGSEMKALLNRCGDWISRSALASAVESVGSVPCVPTDVKRCHTPSVSKYFCRYSQQKEGNEVSASTLLRLNWQLS